MAFAVFVEAVFLLGLGSLRYYPLLIFGRRRPIDSPKEELVFIAPPVNHILITSFPLIVRLVIVVLSVSDALRYKIGNLLEEI